MGRHRTIGNPDCHIAFTDDELAQVRRDAATHGLSVCAWIRECVQRQRERDMLDAAAALVEEHAA